MSVRKQPFSDGEYYHIYNRGNSKQNIFLDEQDYRIFQKFLYLMNMENRIKSREIGENVFSYDYDRKSTIVAIGAYCLMPNHFHILITQKIEGGISKFMQKLSTAYAMYFNKKYKRTGGLFEGRFKSKYVDTDEYMKYLYAYIHLNPMKLINNGWNKNFADNNGLDFVMNYKFSSLPNYMGLAFMENNILDDALFPDYFPTKEHFERDILNWIKIKQNV